MYGWTKQAEKLKIAMEVGNIFFDGFNGIYDGMFKSSATHADTPKLITAEQFSNVCRLYD